MTVLLPMRPEVFATTLPVAIADYAAGNVAVGRSTPATALELSRSDFAALLPQGLATPNQHWLEIHAGSGGVTAPPHGHLWFAVQDGPDGRGAFVYQLFVMPAHRRQGHARRACHALEALAREMGVARIGLHVFGFNDAAQALYRSLGYTVSGLNMAKTLAVGAAV